MNAKVTRSCNTKVGAKPGHIQNKPAYNHKEVQFEKCCASWPMNQKFEDITTTKIDLNHHKDSFWNASISWNALCYMDKTFQKCFKCFWPVRHSDSVVSNVAFAANRFWVQTSWLFGAFSVWSLHVVCVDSLRARRLPPTVQRYAGQLTLNYLWVWTWMVCFSLCQPYGLATCSGVGARAGS